MASTETTPIERCTENDENNSMELETNKNNARKVIIPAKRFRSQDRDDNFEISDDEINRIANINDSSPPETTNSWTRVTYKKQKPQWGTHLERFDEPKIVIVVKPTTQTRISNISSRILMDQLKQLFTIPCNRDRLSYDPNHRNNTIAITVYSEAYAGDILQMSTLTLGDGTEVGVQTYRSTTGLMPRGVIHDVDAEFTAQDIVDYSDSDYCNVLHARPIGRRGTFLLTFDGNRVPRKITHRGRLFRVYTYKPTAVLCLKCHGIGHKAAVCTREQRCRRCGEPHPEGEQCEDTYCPNCHVSGHTAFDPNCETKKSTDAKLQRRAQAITQTKSKATNVASASPWKRMATALHNQGTVRGRTSFYQNRFSTLQDLEEFPPLENTGSTKKGPTGTNCTAYKQDLPNANANMAKRTSSTNKTSIEAKENQLKELERRVAQLKVEIEKDKQEEERAKQRRQTELEKKKQDAIKKSVEQTMVLIPSFTKNPTPSENPPICAVTQATQSGNWEEKVLRFVETQAQQTQQTQQMLHQQIQQQIQQQQQMQQMMQQFQIMFMQFQKSQVQQCSIEDTSTPTHNAEQTI